MKDFRELKVWEKAHFLTLDIYHATYTFPREERFGITAQVRRAVTSIPTNIAEGCGRNGDRELARFMAIAAGSASETEYLLLLAKDLGYLKEDTHSVLDETVNEVKRMLNRFIRTLSSRGS
jgi:four helix bundle protein